VADGDDEQTTNITISSYLARRSGTHQQSSLWHVSEIKQADHLSLAWVQARRLEGSSIKASLDAGAFWCKGYFDATNRTLAQQTPFRPVF